MVENFTRVDENVEDIEVERLVSSSFEDSIKQSVISFVKSPNEKTIKKILHYSKALREN